jgi:hypothetical protein
MDIFATAASSAVQSLTIAKTASTDQRQRIQIAPGDSARRAIGYRPVLRFVEAPSRIDLDLRDPISYQQFVAWGRSMIGGDTSGMLDI